MSYHPRYGRRRVPKAALAGDYGPSWYRAMNGVSTQLPSPRIGGSLMLGALGSLGDDPPADTTLSTPTVTDPTFQWQGQVLAQLQAGVEEMKRSDRYKLLQIIATLSIPLAAAAWRVIFRRGADPTM